MTYSYILLSGMHYEGPWIHGVVHSLGEALQYFVNKQEIRESEMSEEEKLERKDYFFHYVQVWSGTLRICTYDFNSKSRTLEKQELSYGEKGDETLVNCVER